MISNIAKWSTLQLNMVEQCWNIDPCSEDTMFDISRWILELYMFVQNFSLYTKPKIL